LKKKSSPSLQFEEILAVLITTSVRATAADESGDGNEKGLAGDPK